MNLVFVGLRLWLEFDFKQLVDVANHLLVESFVPLEAHYLIILYK